MHQSLDVFPCCLSESVPLPWTLHHVLCFLSPFPWLLVLHPFLWNLYFLWIPYLFLPQFPFPFPSQIVGLASLVIFLPALTHLLPWSVSKPMPKQWGLTQSVWFTYDSSLKVSCMNIHLKNKQSLYVWNDAAALLTLRSIRLSAMPTEKNRI